MPEFAADAADSADARFAGLFELGSENNVLFFVEIKTAVRRARLPYLDKAQITESIRSSFALHPNRPSKSVHPNGGPKRQGAGFQRLRLKSSASAKPQPTPGMLFENLFEVGRSTEVMFFSDIAAVLNNNGLFLKHNEIADYIFKTFNITPSRPTKCVKGRPSYDRLPGERRAPKVSQQGRGFRCLRRRAALT